jgi:hypothetical protein
MNRLRGLPRERNFHGAKQGSPLSPEIPARRIQKLGVLARRDATE